jgi:hypothetical protein
MAEGVRFELTESLKTLNGFRGRRLKPLGHPSGNLILAFQTGCSAPGCKFNLKSTTCFCLFGLWPKIQATRYAGGS